MSPKSVVSGKDSLALSVVLVEASKYVAPSGIKSPTLLP